MEFLSQLGLSRDSLLLVLPVLIVVIIIAIILISRRKSTAGIGLLAVTGILGFFFLKNKRLEQAFDTESKLAKKNKKIEEFKKRQKDRYNAITANEQVIEELQKRLAKLKENAAKNRVEIQLLEKEISEREEYGKRLLEDEDFFPVESGSETSGGDQTFGVYDLEETRQPPQANSGEDIEIDGYRLLDA